MSRRWKILPCRLPHCVGKASIGPLCGRGLEPSEVSSTQIDYHSGWHARAGRASLPVFADGLGFMAINPRCSGDCEITIEFDGGAESEGCRAAAAAVLLMALAAAARGAYGWFSSRVWV
jgi:hypothetical protein